MTRFDTRYGAAALGTLAMIYMVASLVSGRSAASALPPDLSAPEAGVGVWQALALLAGGEATLIDVRSDEQASLYALPRSVRAAPDAGAVRRALAEGQAAVVVADSDARAAELVGALRQDDAGTDAAGHHFLRGGARAWYLALELPVPLFAEQQPPFGYKDALRRVRAWLDDPESPLERSELRQAIEKLAAADYQPTRLQSKTKPKSSGKRKKITGGCG